ncbi:MAG: methyltransferase domain-containing protein [Bacteroidota bacterium]
MDLSVRSSEIELMDQPGLSADALHKALLDVNFCNQWLGGYQLTIRKVVQYIKANPKPHYTIMDVGCGDGAMLRKLLEKLQSNRIAHTLIGVDINTTALEIAKNTTEAEAIKYRQCDILKDQPDPCDIVLCTLTLHHLPEKQILTFVERLVYLAKDVVIINDLERSAVSHLLFKIFGFFFLKSPIAKNDGLTSIRRAFQKSELISLAQLLKYANHSITRGWAFRWLWVLQPKN